MDRLRRNQVSRGRKGESIRARVQGALSRGEYPEGHQSNANTIALRPIWKFLAHDLILLFFPTVHRVSDHLFEADGLGAIRQAMVFVDLIAIRHPRTGEPD